MADDTLEAVREVLDIGAAAFRPRIHGGAPVPGLTWLPLDFDEAKGSGFYLVRFAPGAQSAPHEHVFGEAFIVLEGRLIDSDERELTSGTFVNYAPGSRHNSTAPEGCLLAVYLKGPSRRL